MICPYCKKDGWLPYQSQRWLESYGGESGKCLTVTECCDKPITIQKVTNYRIEKYTGEEIVDDWGREIKRESKSKAKPT